MLVVSALSVKSHTAKHLPGRAFHDWAEMPKKPASPLAPKRIVGRNIVLLIGDLSVNEWAIQHELSQTTINRIVRDRLDPTTTMVEKIAERAGVQPYRLLMPDLGLQLGQPTPKEQQTLLAVQVPKQKFISEGGQEWSESAQPVVIEPNATTDQPAKKKVVRPNAAGKGRRR